MSYTSVKAAYLIMDDVAADKIDSTLFTHIFCSYDTIPDSSEFSLVAQTIRKKNKDVQLIMSSGSSDEEENTYFGWKLNEPAFRKSFIQDLTKTARALGFDGIDIRWQYPSNDVEMRDFGLLLKEWRSALEDESLWTGKPLLLLTAAVFYSPVYKTFSYPVEEIAESVDWVNLIFYDFHKLSSSLVTGPPAALFDPSNSEGLSGDSGLKQWIEAGLPENKAVFGFSYVGWEWMLEDVNNHGHGAPAEEEPSMPFMEYGHIRKYILCSGAAMVHDPTVVGDYCYAGTRWIGYDDNPSIVKKVTYAHKRGLRGYFGWHLGADYKCGLSRAANQAWNVAEAAITGKENPIEE